MHVSVVHFFLLKSSTPLGEYATVCYLFFYSWTLVVSVVNEVAVNISVSMGTCF
jgi:hypothetical protein